MSFFFYCPWHDKNDWLVKIKRRFKNNRILTLRDNPNFLKIKYAIIWDLPDKIYKKLTNVKLLFSMGAGVDHILNLPSYNQVPIVRLRDKLMAQRMSNHVISQILHYQLKLNMYKENQKNHRWIDFIEPLPNEDLQVGILGTGFLGSCVGKTLFELGYKVQGYKNSKPNKKYVFPVFYKKQDLKKIIIDSNILVSILPSTPKTNNFINKDLLQLMQKKALLINVGRGSVTNEYDLINHLRKNKSFYASLDVFKEEPLPKKHIFWRLPNVIVTPHIASLTGINSAVEYMYKKYKEFRINKDFRSDVDLNKGY
tara:strand:- start:1325 stop:2257 length:933 start_codon:yes stop_codon:yes gene_type:complete